MIFVITNKVHFDLKNLAYELTDFRFYLFVSFTYQSAVYVVSNVLLFFFQLLSEQMLRENTQNVNIFLEKVYQLYLSTAEYLNSRYCEKKKLFDMLLEQLRRVARKEEENK